jgi:hypothetical protein
MIVIRGMYGFDSSYREVVLGNMLNKIKQTVSNFNENKLQLVERPFTSNDCTATYLAYWYNVDKQQAVELYYNIEEPFKQSIKRDLQVLGVL